VNIHIYPSTFSNESRILKVVHSLRRRAIFPEIKIIARWKDGLPERTQVEDNIELVRVAPAFGASLAGLVGLVIKTLGWYWAVLLTLRGIRAVCFNCHSLPVLPLAVFIKVWKRCSLVYEPHELETETAGLVGIRRIVARTVERALIRFADAVCVVNQSIAEWYSTHYKLSCVWVIRNVPDSRQKSGRRGLLRRPLGIPDSDRLFLYQGLLAPGRGIELLIKAFSDPEVRDHLVFLGYGESKKKIQHVASTIPNIHFFDAVPPDKLSDYTSDADVGLAVIENICLSYYLSLPNKFFEYALCGVAPVVSDFPEMAQVIDEYGCGWKVKPTAEAIRNLIFAMTESELAMKRANTEQIARNFSWQVEEETLVSMYRSLGFQEANLVQQGG